MNARELQQKLRSIRHAERGIHPDPAWVLRTRGVVLAEVKKGLPTVRLTGGQRLRIAMRSFVPSQLVTMARGPVLAVLSILSVVAGGSIASVSAAEKSIPGDLLYSVKLATEQTQIIFAKTRADKLKLKTDFVQRRVSEIKEIVGSDVPEKKERIKEATEILKRDLDTVKNQLNEVTDQDTAGQAAQAAKLVDRKSTELVNTLKDVKTTVPQEVRSNVAEAEAAAVNTGVRAVQVMIDTKDNPDAKDVVTNDELVRSLHDKVEGLQQNISDAAQRLVDSGVATSTDGMVASSTVSLGASVSASSSISILAPATTGTASSVDQLKHAQVTLDQTVQLLQENRLSEVKDRLPDMVKAIASAENSVDTITASSSAAIIPASNATSTSSGISGSASSSTTSTSSFASSTPQTPPPNP